MTIAENVKRVRQNILSACERVGRNPDSVLLVAVSKTKPAEMILEAAAAGVQHFGESRVEESTTKIPQVMMEWQSSLDPQPSGGSLMWHMIGHIQSRKVRQVIPQFDLVHSVDSFKLAEKFSRLCQDAEPTAQTQDVLIQVNVSGEESKFGFNGQNWRQSADVRRVLFEQIQAAAQLPALNIRGLMTIAPYVDDPTPEALETVRPVFRDLRELRDAITETTGIALPELSMGMTDDYPIAIEEGATMVRVGRAIFGER